MQDTSRLIINHIRIMIEETERAKTEIKVSVAISVCDWLFFIYIVIHVYFIVTIYGHYTLLPYIVITSSYYV